MIRLQRNLLASLATVLVAGSIGTALAQGTFHNPVRHHAARMDGLQMPYQTAQNPFARNAAVLAEGAQLYADNCASCHGAAGMGDGEAGAELKPPPPMLRAVTPQMMQGMGGMGRGMGMGNMRGMRGMGMGGMGMGGMRGMGMRRGMGPGMGRGMRMGRMMQMFKSDSYLMWTVSEGGEPLGTDMPGFKDVLSEEQRWKIISYVQADFPRTQ